MKIEAEFLHLEPSPRDLGVVRGSACLDSWKGGVSFLYQSYSMITFSEDRTNLESF